MKVFVRILILIILIPCKVFSAEYLYILDDKCITDLYSEAETFFRSTDVKTIKDSRGLILRYEFEDPIYEYYNLNLVMFRKIEYFLAKIENPAIIEVHVGTFLKNKSFNLKKWEISTIIANKIEAIITLPVGSIKQNRINSIGYGEFLPAKNTPNNGGKNSNRVDIIILCSISGE